MVTKSFCFKIDKDIADAFKKLAVDKNTTQKDLLVKLIVKELNKNDNNQEN